MRSKTPTLQYLRVLMINIVICVSSVALADTGDLKITVTDNSGAPLEGATVTARTSESLVSKSGMTDEAGTVRLVGLEPSATYAVEVKKDGYRSLRNEEILVVSGSSFALTYQLENRDTSIEEIVVKGRQGVGPLVDTTSALVSTDITLDLTESLPTGRSYQSYLQLAPTTKPTLNGNPSSTSGVNYSDAVDSNGNTSGVSTDNVYYIDGINITDNLVGTFGANFNSEIIQEQQIITGGAPAEYEGGQGLISRVVTKSGSNEFSGSVNYYSQSDSLVSSNKNLEDSSFSTFDSAFTFGGPIIKDKLWFFSSFQRKERDEDIVDPNTDTFLRTVKTEQDLGFLKVTYAPTGEDILTAEYFNDPYERSGSDDILVLNNRDSARIQGGDNYKFSYSHSWSDLILTGAWARHEGEVSRKVANSATRNDVAFLDPSATNADTDLGGVGSNTIDLRNKEELSITAEYFLNTDFGYHKIKAGVSRIQNERDYNLVYTGDGAQYTSIGTAFSGTALSTYTNGAWTGETDIVSDDRQRIIDAMAGSPDAAFYLGLLDADTSGDISLGEIDALMFSSTAGNPNGMVNVYRIDQTQQAPVNFETKGNVFYVQDSWSIDEYWTVNAGIRAEEWRHYATDGSEIFKFDYEFAPRLSVVYDLFGDGSSKVWGFMGRYYDPIRTDMTQFAGTLTGSVREEQVFVNDRWLTFRTRGGSQEQDAYFAPATKTPYTDEYQIGFEHSLNDEMSVSVNYSDRTTKDLLEDYDLGLYTDPAQVGDYALPLSYFGYSSVPDSNYVIATLKGGKREYKGLGVTFRKRRGIDDNWQALASYSYNDAKGNSNSDGNADFQGDVVWLDPRAPGMFSDQPGNIKHLLKLFGSYAWDNGIEVGAVYNWNSGIQYSETFAASGRHLPVRVGTAYVDGNTSARWVQDGAVGSRESDSYGTLDLRAKYTYYWNEYTAEVFLDIFNVLDDQAVTRSQDLSAGGDGIAFGQGTSWVEPRRYYLGARVSF